MKKILIILILISVLSSCRKTSHSNPFLDQIQNYPHDENKLDDYLTIYNETNNLIYALNKINYPLFLKPNQTNNKYLLIDNLLLVNTNYYFEKNYTPTNLVKVTNVDFIKRNNQTMTLEKSTLDNYVMLYNEASKLGLNLTLFSGYRSYSYQENLYNNSTTGFVAKPGSSEHQSGYAVDVSTKECGLTTNFENTLEFTFLKNNAHKYGFILRYPKNKEDITGYPYEPWHYRYVGNTCAKIIYQENLTLEEYFYYYLVL